MARRYVRDSKGRFARTRGFPHKVQLGGYPLKKASTPGVGKPKPRSYYYKKK